MNELFELVWKNLSTYIFGNMTVELWHMLDVFLAGILGLFIGLERKFRSKEA